MHIASKEEIQQNEGPEPEVSIQMTAADISASLTLDAGKWTLTVNDTGFSDPRCTDNATERGIQLVGITTLQASAIVALFTGYGEDKEANELVTEHLYKFAEQVFTNREVPKNLRIIP